MTSAAVHDARTRALELIAAGAELDDVLTELATGLELGQPELRVAIRLLDAESRTLHCVAAPTLDPAYVSALDSVIIGPAVNTCGSAAWSGEPVVTEDVGTDPRWTSTRALALAHGIRRAWSWPVQSAEGTVLGTITFHGAAPGRPSDAETTLMRDSACLAAIAIESRQTIRRLTHDARIDSLTGLPNRRAVFAGLQDALRRSVAGGEVALLFIDLDSLKRLNDTLGHERGDAIIQEVAGRLRDAGAPHLVGRLAGDEFVVIMFGAEAVAATALADRVLAALGEPMACVESVTVSASIGIAVAGADSDAAEALRRADGAMYEAKRAGGARWAVFGGTPLRAAGRRAALARLIDGAVSRGELTLRYEPFVNLANSAIGGLRAHPTWHSPQLGEVAAGEIFAAARDAGVTVALGAWILRESCEAVTRIAQRSGRTLDVVFTVMPQQLAYPGFARTVGQVLGHAGVAPPRVWLQLSAPCLTDHDPRVARARRDLGALGVRLALAHADRAPIAPAELGTLALDGLSLNSETVAGLPADPVAGAVAGGLAAVGGAAGMALCAGGVTSQAQRDAVRALGFARGHGPLFGDPQSEDEILTALEGLAAAA